MSQRTDELELPSTIRFKRREWAVQRVGWVLMLLLVVAAAEGLFGGGPLSAATAGTGDSALSVEYQRFLRFQTPTQLELEVGPAAVRDGQAEITIGEAYLAAIEVMNVTPEPLAERASAEGVTYTIAVSGTSAARVIVRIKPVRMGRVRGEIGVVGGQQLQINQFVHP